MFSPILIPNSLLIMNNESVQKKLGMIDASSIRKND
jgi:hypothetical protein